VVVSYVTEVENKKLEHYMKVKQNLEDALELQVKQIQEKFSKTEWRNKKRLKERQKSIQIKVIV